MEFVFCSTSGNYVPEDVFNEAAGNPVPKRDFPGCIPKQIYN